MRYVIRGPCKNTTTSVCMCVCACSCVRAHIKARPRGALVSGSIWSPDVFFAAPPPLALFVCVIVCVSP